MLNFIGTLRGLRRKATIATAIALTAFVASGCVNNTLNSTNTQPINAANQALPNYDPIQRADAVAEIRQKAANANSGVLTNAFVDANGPNEPLSRAESAVKIQALQQSAVGQNVSTSDPELATKQRQIKALQEKARTHYGNAVNAIEN